VIAGILGGLLVAFLVGGWCGWRLRDAEAVIQGGLDDGWRIKEPVR